jgi:hypothetical protein
LKHLATLPEDDIRDIARAQTDSHAAVTSVRTTMTDEELLHAIGNKSLLEQGAVLRAALFVGTAMHRSDSGFELG